MQIQSVAWADFNENMNDVDRLLSIHRDLSGKSPGRKYGVDVLNKAGIILLTACWEAFIEDLFHNAFEFLIDKVSIPSRLPNRLLTQVATRLKSEKHELSVWRLSDDGWINELRQFCTNKIRQLNTPNAPQVDELFASVLGLSNLSRSWKWRRMSNKSAVRKLNELIDLRNALAHRTRATHAIGKARVIAYKSHVQQLVRTSVFAVAHYMESKVGYKETRRVLF